MRTWLIKTDCLGILNQMTTGGIMFDAKNQDDVRRVVEEKYPKHCKIKEIIALTSVHQ